MRLQQTAQATRQSFDAVVLRALQVGAPPSWEDAPTAFQADLAVLDQLDDDRLWHIARRRQTAADMTRYQALLGKNANNPSADTEQAELTRWRTAADRFMLRKVHAAALLRWRGHHIPPAYAVLRHNRLSSTSPEALPPSEDKIQLDSKG